MASINQLPSGSYRAQIFINGMRESRVFKIKREATIWAASRETELRSLQNSPLEEKYTLLDAINRYQKEVSPTKRGGTKEIIRLEAIKRLLPVHLSLSEISTKVLNDFKEARLKVVKPGSVKRDFSLLSSLFETVRREWKWIKENPVKDIRRPSSPPHREIVINRKQVIAMLRTMNYRSGTPVRSVTDAVAVTFLVALRTGMRAGELCGLTWDRVFSNHCHLPVTKTKPRSVPLTPKAMRLINAMRGFDPVYVFGITSQSLDALFRKYRKRAGLEGFTFHDARHTAATWMVNNTAINVLELCKIFGWSNPKMAMIYFAPSPEDLLKQMNKRK